MQPSEVAAVSDRFQAMINKILQHFAGEAFKDQVRFAKSEFFDNAGILEEQSEQFELRMSQFFDWYFFTREVGGFSATPLESATVARGLRFSPEELTLLESLKGHRHSIFEFIKIKDSDIHLKDLLRNDKIVVRQAPYLDGFDSDELFEVRVVPFEGNWIFTKGFCFHPVEAKKFILQEIKRHRKDPDLDQEEMMLNLIKMRYKFERYRHVKIQNIYTSEAR